MDNIRWKMLVKIFCGKYSVDTCWWKIFGRMGGDQLTWGVELTVEDKLTGGGHTFNKACIYGGKTNGDTNHHHQQTSEYSVNCLWKMET